MTHVMAGEAKPLAVLVPFLFLAACPAQAQRSEVERYSWIESLSGEGVVDLVCRGECLERVAATDAWRAAALERRRDQRPPVRLRFRVDEVYFDGSGTVEPGAELALHLYQGLYPGINPSRPRGDLGEGIFRLALASEEWGADIDGFFIFGDRAPREPNLERWLARLAREARVQPPERDRALSASLSDLFAEDWPALAGRSRDMLEAAWVAEVEGQQDTGRTILHAYSKFWKDHLALFCPDTTPPPDKRRLWFLNHLLQVADEPVGYRDMLRSYVEKGTPERHVAVEYVGPYLYKNLKGWFSVRVAEALHRELAERDLDRILLLLMIYTAQGHRAFPITADGGSEEPGPSAYGPVPEILLRPLDLARPGAQEPLETRMRFWEIQAEAFRKIEQYATLGAAMRPALRILLEDPAEPYEDHYTVESAPGDWVKERDMAKCHARRLARAGTLAAEHVMREISTMDQTLLERMAGMALPEAVTRAYDRAETWYVREALCRGVPLDRAWTIEFLVHAGVDPEKDVRVLALQRLIDHWRKVHQGAREAVPGVDYEALHAAVDSMREGLGEWDMFLPEEWYR